MKRILCLTIVMVMMFAFASTALAVGESLSHYGTSTSGYYTDDYFDQMNDRNIYCTYAYSTNPMKAAPAIYVNSAWQELTSRMDFTTGHLFILQTSTSVRRVHMHLINTTSASTYSSGEWELRA